MYSIARTITITIILLLNLHGYHRHGELVRGFCIANGIRSDHETQKQFPTFTRGLVMIWIAVIGLVFGRKLRKAST